MAVTRDGAFPEEEKCPFPGTDYYCYSKRLVSDVIEHLKVAVDSRIIDIAAGAGAMSHDFLNKLPNARVTGIDPYVCKTPASIRHFQGRLNSAEFNHLQTSAEATGLDDASVDLVICGQGFSLLKFLKTREETRRILKPGCGAALFFIHGADRAWTGLEEFLLEMALPEPPTPFMGEFWALIKEFFHLPYGQRMETHFIDQVDPETTAYQEPMRTTSFMKSFFHNDDCRIRTVTELWGLYNFTDVYTMCRWTKDMEDNAKQDDDRQHRDFMLDRERRLQECLRAIFDRHQVDGRVAFYHYVTVFYGHVT